MQNSGISEMEWRCEMIVLKSLMAATLLLMATSVFGAAESPTWPGPSLAALLGVVIVVFVLIRWKSKL